MKSDLHTWKGLVISISLVRFGILASGSQISQSFEIFFFFFTRASIPNFFISLLAFDLLHPSSHHILLAQYQGWCSCVLSISSFRRLSFSSILDLYENIFLQTQKSFESKDLLHSLSSFMMLRARIFLLVFFFETLNNDAESSYYPDKVIFLPFEFVYLFEIWHIGSSCIIDFFWKPFIDGTFRNSKFFGCIRHRPSVLLYLLQYRILYLRRYLAEIRWHIILRVSE